MAGHSLFAPSAAARWSRCRGALALSQALKIKDKSSIFAAEGSVAHHVASEHLGNDTPLDTFLGQKIEHDGFVIEVTQTMLDHVADYANLVREYAQGGTLLVEVRVDFSKTINYPAQTGTSDIVVLHDDRLTVIDLKYGMGVRVDSSYQEEVIYPMGEERVPVRLTKPNEQMALYACGAYEEFGAFADIKEIVLVIHQPRLNHVSEYSMPVAALVAFGAEMAAAVAVNDACLTGVDDYNDHLVPGDKQCKFCPNSARCIALERVVDETVVDDFADMIVASQAPDDQLARAMDRVDAIESWCKAVRAEAERRLLAGLPVPGYKLVDGRQGNRKWTSESDAEAKLKSFRLKQDEMYERSLIPPTKAEKLLKKSDPKRWEKLQELISRGDGKPSVAPAADPRPAKDIQPVTDDFAGLAEAQGN